MNKLNNIQHFQIFCLESYRSVTGISGQAALMEFRRNNVFDYLSTGYEVLHTQGKNYLVADIVDFIERRK
jgi:hypothetical protein